MPTLASTYRAPSRQVQCEPESISLHDFSRDELIEHLAYLDKNPYLIPKGYENGIVISASDAARIATLSLCGKKTEAREFLIELASAQIGRVL